jgi:N,N-dimethylformamidase
MRILGYGDRLSVQQGTSISFMVSSHGPYEAQLVRPSHLEGLRQELDAPFNGDFPGRLQSLPFGSYVAFDRPVPRPSEFLLSAWIMPTAPDRGEDQEILVWGARDGLFVNARGKLELRVGGEALATGAPLRRLEWYKVQAGVEDGRAFVAQQPKRWSGAARVEGRLTPAATTGPFRIGYRFDGKIDSPAVEGVAAWDFSIGIQTLHVYDTGFRRLHGRVVNMPMRAVTGHNWTGREVDFRRTPEEYGAIHFHHDDLDDCRWESDFSFDVPVDLESGLYAVRLRCTGGEDYVPFFVRPLRSEARADVAFLAPTFSYLAYSNEHSSWEGSPAIPEQERRKIFESLSPEDRFTLETGLLSCYDHHRDGTGNCFVSRLRPIVNMRPYYNVGILNGPHQVGADLHILDWLRSDGHEHDVITDEDLHEEGVDLLSRYRVVLTGTHPEYWSGPMLDALEEWLDDGGRLMYLGANGFYWVTDPHPQRPSTVEIRRTHAGTRAWESAPGECHHQGTGEHAGLWRHRGRTPQRLVGVGMSAHGFDYALPFRREPDSGHERAAWIFSGTNPDEEIGNFGACLGGAGGFELDRIDRDLGSPPHVLHLATTTGFSDVYQAVVEEVLMEDSLQGGTINPRVRGDIAFFETQSGGAVFSTSSVTWGTSLTHNGCDNDVARITGNVLRRFADPAPFDSFPG